MRRFQALLTVMSLVVSLGLVVLVGHALADGPSAGSSGIKIAQVHFVDPKLGILQLSDGMELKAPDQRVLSNLKIGEWVKVDYVTDFDHTVLNSIAPARPDEIPSASPAPATTGGSPTGG
jgi:hypothetical protein